METFKPKTLNNEENKYWEAYKYGKVKEKLKIGREVEGNITSGAKTLIFNRLASVGTGIQSFTGFGFTPTCYTIQATRTNITTSGNPCFSDGAYDGTTQLYRQVADGYSRALTGKVVRIFYTNQGGGVTSAIHSSFDSDGISLNFDFSAEDCYLVITAYK